MLQFGDVVLSAPIGTSNGVSPLLVEDDHKAENFFTCQHATADHNIVLVCIVFD